MLNHRYLNHKDLVLLLEKYLRGKETANLITYSGLDESPEFLRDLEAVKQGSKDTPLEEDFYHYGSLLSDLVVVERRFELPDTTSDPSAKRRKVNYYTLFLAISSEEALNTRRLMGKPYRQMKKRLLFYLYYFSRIVEPRRFRIINVFPKAIRVPKGFKDFCRINGFGISFIDTETGDYEQEIESKSLRERIGEKFKEYIDRPENLGETLAGC